MALVAASMEDEERRRSSGGGSAGDGGVGRWMEASDGVADGGRGGGRTRLTASARGGRCSEVGSVDDGWSPAVAGEGRRPKTERGGGGRPTAPILHFSNSIMSTEPDFFEIDLGAEFEYDLDSLLADLDETPAIAENSELPVSASLMSEIEPPALTDESESPESASMMREIEKLLFYDEEDANDGCDDGDYASDLFSDLFAVEVKCADVAPDEIIAGDAPAESPEEAPEEEEGDPVSKKRKRQMRNKEAAMKSRERKNLYVKELEMKSKYMQMECQRLDFALRCCMAENIVLRQSLHRPFGAPMARQESAVLFVESLLLGSLFWLMSTVCLLLLPVLPIRKQRDVSRLGGSFAREVVLTRNIANERIGSGLGLVILRRRCRGMKIKMRSMFLSSYVTPVLLASG